MDGAGQAEAVVLDILPALPAAWPEGAVKGLRARGGFGVDIVWRGGRVTSLRVHAAQAGACVISMNGERRRLTLGAGQAETVV